MNASNPTTSSVENNSPSQGKETACARHNSRRLRIVALSFLLSLIAVIVIGFILFKTGRLENVLVNFFGPPKVKLHEAYDEKTGGPEMDHSLFESLLKNNVDSDGWVNYENIKNDPKLLDNYIAALRTTPFDDMGRSQKLALLINAYNAFTIKLIVENYPLSSIKDIPAAKRWDDIRWNVGGHVWSLTQIEQKQIRPKFKEPRIHFALVCGAIGCPPLRNEVYQANHLEAQLSDQAVYVHSHQTWFQFDSTKDDLVRLTKLYSWYGDDFTQVAGSPIDFAARYSPQLQQSLNSGTSPRIFWLDYDWTLNDKKNKSPR